MIKQLRIQNFKSLRDVTLDLQRVNLLIGPNNCGKTNVLKALKFFSEFLVDRYYNYAPINSLCFRIGQAKHLYNPITLRLYDNTEKVFAGWQLRDNDTHVDYGIVVGNSDQPFLYDNSLLDVFSLDESFDRFTAVYFWEDFPWDDEEILIPDNYKETSGSGQVSGYHIRKIGDGGEYRTSIAASVNNNMPRYVGGMNEWRPLRDILIYRPDPTKLLGPYPVANEESVTEDASNLVAFLQIMRNKYHDVYKRIENDLQRFVPEFTAISFDIVEVAKDDPIRIAYPDKSFAKVGLLDKHKRTFWAEDLSEGILYFLALLSIIHQPNPPKILLLEEPEKGIHPRRIREVLDLIFELAEEKDIQVIMTTHSPLVVDRFSDIPESVFILEKPENETIVKNLQRDIIEPIDEKFRKAGEEPIPFTEALGENWAMGFLGGVPHDRI